MDQAAIIFATSLTTGGLPVLLACATILGLLSIRNAHISDRARQMQDRRAQLELEILTAKGELRNRIIYQIKNVSDQEKIFMDRYTLTARSLIVLTLAFISFIIADVAAPRPNEKLAGFPVVAESAVFIGVIFLATGLLMLIGEFAQGHRTLELNSRTSPP